MITTVTLNASIDKAYYMESSIENGTVMRVKAVHNSAGGKGLNVARAVRLCGEEVLATGLVGGYNGKYLEALLDKDGVSHDFVHIQGETRSCINILDEAYGSTEYLEPGCLVTGWEIQQFLKQFPEIIKESSVVTMSGSVPAGVGKEIYKELTDMVKTAGKQVILDTSGELLKQGIESCPTVVKPNQEELEMLFHTKIRGREDVIERAKEIRAGIPWWVPWQRRCTEDGSRKRCCGMRWQWRPPMRSRRIPGILIRQSVKGCSGRSNAGGFAEAFQYAVKSSEKQVRQRRNRQEL